MTLLSLHPILLLTSTLIATFCALTLALQLWRVKIKLTQCRAELSSETLVPAEPVVEKITPRTKPQPADFADSLHQAALKQRLEKGPARRQPPEKYRYAAALADQGMDAGGIAAVLQFPIEAAEQIIALKRAAQIDPATTGPDK